MTNLPSLSIVIPTKNRQADLERTLRSILKQSVVPTQLVVVDQSETNACYASMQALISAAALDGQAQLVYIHDPTISGGAAARNRGIEVATNDVCLFLDDDVVLEREFVERLLEVYRDYPDIDGVSGIISNYRAPSWAYRAWLTIFARGWSRDERQLIYWSSDRLRYSAPISVRKFTGALMSFRTEAIQELRFDENLRGVCDGEDIDFCLRLKGKLVIHPQARLEHLHSPAGRMTDHWLRRTVRGNHYVYWCHWHNSFRNRLCFMWLNCGYVLVALAACFRRKSVAPLCALRAGMRDAKTACQVRRAADVPCEARRMPETQ